MQYNAIPCYTMQYHASLITADGAYHCPVGSIMAIFSSVRSSNSHPDLLLIHHQQHPHFFRSHRSSTLDFHFLSHYSYIKGNHWTHLLATCIPYGYNMLQKGATSRNMVQHVVPWCKIVQDGARWFKIVQEGARWCKLVQDSAR